jgi:hypothetical protein
MPIQIGTLQIMALTPDTTVQEIADPAIVITSQTVAAAQTNNATAQANIATAQAGIKDAAQTLATELANANLEELKPYLDHQVWLTAAAARATHPDRVVSSHPEVAVFADKILAAYKTRFPRA